MGRDGGEKRKEEKRKGPRSGGKGNHQEKKKQQGKERQIEGKMWGELTSPGSGLTALMNWIDTPFPSNS